MSDKPASLAAALAAFQADLPRLGKSNTANTGTFSYRYADLAEVCAVVLPAIARHGLSFSSRPTIRDGRTVLVSTLRFAGSEECDEAEWELPKGSPQQVGSAITYGRRYCLLAMTGVAPDEDDDDGHAASVQREEPDEAQHVIYAKLAAAIQAAQSQSDINDCAEAARDARNDSDITPMQYDRLGRMAAAKVATFVGGSTGGTPDGGGSMTRRTQGRMFALFTELGFAGDENQQQRRDICTLILARPVESIRTLSEADAQAVVAGLDKRKREMAVAK